MSFAINATVKSVEIRNKVEILCPQLWWSTYVLAVFLTAGGEPCRNICFRQFTMNSANWANP